MTVGSHLQVTGTGTPPNPTTSETQRRSESRDAALRDAWSRLRGYIESLSLESGETLGNRSRHSPRLRRKIGDLVRSADRVSATFDGNRATVAIRINKDRINKVLGTKYR